MYKHIALIQTPNKDNLVSVNKYPHYGFCEEKFLGWYRSVCKRSNSGDWQSLIKVHSVKSQAFSCEKEVFLVLFYVQQELYAIQEIQAQNNLFRLIVGWVALPGS